ncbi:cytochrome P450 [Auriscalpium vulgare]|uniref:Cytochrome P450 n=1 Tax=Auriscalpium vulgare TaxID=40419 RepID=A0ACB8RTK5_9AGAM|nr:cytochrome P450 [Auriscalpium vulgare]
MVTPSFAVVALLPLVGLLTLIVSLVFFAVRHRFRQLPLRAIPGPPRASFVEGNLGQMYNPQAKAFHRHLTKTYGDIIKVNGLLGDIQIQVADPRACQSILQEHDVFEMAPWFLEMNRHVLGSGLFSTTGPHHRKQRKMLNPMFSTKSIRSMTPLFQKITHQLEDALSLKVESGPQELDMMEWVERVALELVAQGGFGYSFGSLEGESNKFGLALKDFLPSISGIMLWCMNFHRVSMLPASFLRGVASWLPWQSLHRVIGIVDVMSAHAKAVFEDKKYLLDKGDVETVHQIGEGRDIISIFLKANMSATDEDRLPEEEILAQMNTFLFAGTDTTSAALSRVLYLLSENQDVQMRLRQELLEAQSTADGGQLGFDELAALPYLEAVCRESLRVFPPVTFVNRTCRKDIFVPLGHPIETSTGDVLNSLYVPNGTDVAINILAMNLSTAIWGHDAEEWKPERWLAPLPETVEEARIPGVYANTMTFLGGSRSCIGFKFSQLSLKVTLAQLIPSFRFSPSKKEEVEWRFGVTTIPGIKGSDALDPKLPMMVERVEI